IERVLLGYPAGTACEHMHVHPFIVVCRLDKRKRHLATTRDADNSRSDRARRSLSKHGIPPSADVLRRECKGRQSKSNSCKMRSPCWRRLDCCVFSSYLDAESSRSSTRHSDGDVAIERTPGIAGRFRLGAARQIGEKVGV